MSPFSHFLHDLRICHGVRQFALTEWIGYEQSYTRPWRPERFQHVPGYAHLLWKVAPVRE